MWFIHRKKPIVSAIIASYNHASYIHEAITSVLHQDVRDIEVIVVDDGSTDGSREVIGKIRDPRIRFIRLPENRRYHARNVGLSVARGEYIAFQNSDDRWRPGKLRKELAAFESIPNLSACFTGISVIDERGDILRNSWAEGIFTRENRGSARWLRRFFDAGNCLCIASSMIKRKGIAKVGRFRPDYINLSDLDLWVRLAAIGEFHIVPDELTEMRIVYGKNISAPTGEAIRRSAMEFLEILQRYTKRPIIHQLKNIFPDIYPKEVRSEVGLLGGLARYAWEKNPAHVMFANSIIASLIEDDKKREELISLYGTGIIHTFIRERGAIEISLAND